MAPVTCGRHCRENRGTVAWDVARVFPSPCADGILQWRGIGLDSFAALLGGSPCPHLHAESGPEITSSCRTRIGCGGGQCMLKVGPICA